MVAFKHRKVNKILDTMGSGQLIKFSSKQNIVMEQNMEQRGEK